MRLRIGTAALALGAALLGIAPVGATDSACAWPAQLDSAAFNVAYPDQAAHYWITSLPAAEGVSLEIRGTFPWARYMSFVTYNEAAQSVDGIHDAEIVPDPGSTNPFLPGADRTATSRSYTVRVAFGRVDPPEPNTVYTTSEDASKHASSFILAYRVFRPDRRFAEAGDRAGGAGLPSVTIVLPDGGRIPVPQCTIPGTPPNEANEQIANAMLPAGSPLGGGFDPPVWHKFFNTADSVATATDNPRSGTAFSDLVRPHARTLPRGGFADNPDNNYIFSFVNHASFGPVLVVRGKLPTTPDTYEDAAVMGSGQLRYWSLCTNHGPSQRYYACLADDQVRTDANGVFTIVISKAADKPANAGCRGNWLAGGPTNDKVLILRNMLPDPSFSQAIQHVTGWGDADLRSPATGMGAYYPAATYTTREAFEALGCPEDFPGG